MKSLRYPIVYVAALCGAALAHFHLPKGDLELKTYPKVSATEFAVMREEALSLAAEDAALGAGRSEARYFELICRGESALLVDNSSSQLLIFAFSVPAPETPCARPLRSLWNSRFIPDG